MAEDSEESDEATGVASPIEDMSSLPGQTVSDQEGVDIGEVKDVYAVSDDAPMWVTIEASTGLAGSKVVFVPIARLKEEDGNLRVPYSAEWIKESPEVESEDELSAEDDRKLRDYYAIDHADQEFRAEGESYASKVPKPEHAPQKVSAEDVGEPQGAEPPIPGEGRSEDKDSDEKGSEDRDSDEERSEAKASADEGGEEESSDEGSEGESSGREEEGERGESEEESGKSEGESGKSEGESGKSEEEGSEDERSEEK